MSKVNATLAAAFAGAVLIAAAPVLAAQCQPAGGFHKFIAAIKQEAAAKGISQRGLAALDGLTLDPKVLASDRRQGVFRQSFEQFSGRMISRDRLIKGARLMQHHAAMLRRIEQRFGVPGAVVVAIWGLETDYGVNQGRLSVVRSVATLAYDCRRSAKFQAELIDALRIVDRGDMTAAELRGDWAGEIGQTQFLPSSYVKYAVNFDGRGHADLIRSAPDALASTANYLRSHGWQRGQGWDQGQPNFAVIREWNKAEVYARTIALFAEKLDRDRSGRGAPR
jgi:lytic murein transglycosylase